MEKIEKHRLTNIQRFDKDRDGKPLKTKDNRTYTRLRFQTEEYGEKWVSGFGNAQNQGWEVGSEVEVIIYEKDGYLNFAQPKVQDISLERIEGKLNQILDGIEAIQENLSKRP